jgi:hypothetical protein
MLKKSLIKKLNKLLLSVNERIESFFNSLKVLITSKKKLSLNERIENFFNNLKVLITSKKKIKVNLLNLDKRIIMSAGAVIILIFTYFLIPTFYDQNSVKISLKNQIQEKYNLEVKFEKDLRYSLFPKPHFYIKDLIINYKDNDLAKTDITKIYISINNFFLLKNIKVKNLFFKQTEFYIDSKNFDFFEKILNSNKSKNYINFKNSKLFYQNINEDVVFLTNIINLRFLYDDEFNQQLYTSLEIFNVPLKIKIVNNSEKKNTFIEMDSYNLRLNIQNNFNYNKENIPGLLTFKVINKLKKISYIMNKNSLNFNSVESDIKGRIDFKPFYLSSDLKFSELDMRKLFRNNSIFLDLLKADILNNQSLNSVINVNFEKIKNINYLKNFDLKIYFEEGKIFIKDSTFNWKSSILITIDNVELISAGNKIIFIGTLSFDFKDIDDFYSQYQIKKNYRKKINKIKLDFLLNLTNNEIQFDNIKVDGSSKQITDNYINNLNSKKLNLFNRVILKNSIKEFFGNI